MSLGVSLGVGLGVSFGVDSGYELLIRLIKKGNNSFESF